MFAVFPIEHHQLVRDSLVSPHSPVPRYACAYSAGPLMVAEFRGEADFRYLPRMFRFNIGLGDTQEEAFTAYLVGGTKYEPVLTYWDHLDSV